MGCERVRLQTWLAVVVVLGCSGCKDDRNVSPSPARGLAVPEFHEMLNDRERTYEIERIKIELGDGDDAQYLVTLRRDSVRRVVHAPFSSTLVEKISQADIPYWVTSKDAPRSSGERQLDASTFRHVLRDREEVDRIDWICVQPFRRSAARYVMKSRTGLTQVVQAEFPGSIVEAIRAAGISYRTKCD